ncbi:MAG: hypothetical protein EHM78_02365 [Myxococcaceae bacterium]|nr:MAG: hypothetical protein EHM78_02365 [Myxococcaceae bacterium]
MSTFYYLRQPVSRASIESLSHGYCAIRTDPDRSEILYDGYERVEAEFDKATGDLVGFCRWGENDPSNFVRWFDAVGEHDTDDFDFTRLFGELL